MKVKKIIMLLIISLSLCGCMKLEDLNYDDILNYFSMPSKRANVYKHGHQFYIPKGLQVSESGYNYEIIESKDYNYYLYIDLISYNLKKNGNYNVNPKAYYSRKIDDDGTYGYVEINLWQNNQYLIEIMYNYAKIEVMVDSKDIKEVLVNAVNILNSIKYNDIIIDELLENNNLNYTEEVFDIFNNKDTKKETTLEEEKESIKDTNLVNN